MKQMFLFISFFMVNFHLLGQTSNHLTPQEVKDGWILLFNGKDYTGWHKYGGTKIGQAWIIEDESICLDATLKEKWQAMGGGDIVTNDEFENYHLSLEWKISQNGNSGVIFLIHEDPKKYEYTWQTGLEMQVLDNDGHADGKIIKHRAGDLYDLISSNTEPVKNVGEWNKAEIIVNKGTLDYYLNGVNIIHTTLWNDVWNKLIAGSKFKEFNNWGTYKKGKIALQDHGDKVWFKNIKIKKIK